MLFIVVVRIKYRYGRPQITTGQMGFGVVHCCYYDEIYLQLTHRYGRPQITTGHRDWYTVMAAGVKYLQHQYVKTRGIKYM